MAELHKKFFIGGNWKMNWTEVGMKSVIDAVYNVLMQMVQVPLQIVIAPPFPFICKTVELLNDSAGESVDNLISTTDFTLNHCALNLEKKDSELNGTGEFALDSLTLKKAQLQSFLKDSVVVGAQNVHSFKAGGGPFTGEVSVGMLHEIGVQWVIIGHSERRRRGQQIQEDSTFLKEKVEAVLSLKPNKDRLKVKVVNDDDDESFLLTEKGEMAKQICSNHKIDGGDGMEEEGLALGVIYCIGETEDERDAGLTLKVVQDQIIPIVDYLKSKDAKERIVLAYEPVWAIGTGKSASVEQVSESLASIRSWLLHLGVSDQVRIIYGGSVNGRNAKHLAGIPVLDGFLVGGASMDPFEFASIVESARIKY